jgi:hypothetical protein
MVPATPLTHKAQGRLHPGSVLNANALRLVNWKAYGSLPCSFESLHRAARTEWDMLLTLLGPTRCCTAAVHGIVCQWGCRANAQRYTGQPRPVGSL